jgi:hypothetical protein
MGAFLMASVATFTTGRFEMIYIGIPFLVVGFVLSAPTARTLQRRQEELRRDGSTVDLVEAVKTTPWAGSS